MEQCAYCTFPIYIKNCCRFEKQDGVVLMATTRNLKQIDEALQRPGRMDRVFHLQRPTQAEREKILQTTAKETMDNELIDLVDWGKVVANQFVCYFKFPLRSVNLSP
jgi:SpoVK/Ycf46/Vps4 family AAA+-type ATPase